VQTRQFTPQEIVDGFAKALGVMPSGGREINRYGVEERGGGDIAGFDTAAGEEAPEGAPQAPDVVATFAADVEVTDAGLDLGDLILAVTPVGETEGDGDGGDDGGGDDEEEEIIAAPPSGDDGLFVDQTPAFLNQSAGTVDGGLSFQHVPVGSNVFLQGEYMEAGLNALGLTIPSTSAEPAGFHATHSFLGFVADFNG